MKQVSFYPRVTIRKIPTTSALISDSKEAMWYNRSELESIRQKCRDIISAFRGDDAFFGRVVDERDEEICLRGLEYHSSSQENRNRACHAVLCAQYIQITEGFDDKDELAEIYRECTISSQRIAHLRGVQDEQTAISDNKCSHDKAGSDDPAGIPYSAFSLWWGQ
jgi:hypothetical protein